MTEQFETNPRFVTTISQEHGKTSQDSFGICFQTVDFVYLGKSVGRTSLVGSLSQRIEVWNGELVGELLDSLAVS